MSLIERHFIVPYLRNHAVYKKHKNCIVLRDAAADLIESQAAEIERLRGVLNEPTLADKLKRLGYKPHGKDIYIPALKETQ